MSELLGAILVRGGVRILAPCVALLLPGATAAQQPAPTRLAFTNVTLIDGTGGPARSGMTVVVDSGTVRAVFRTGEDTIGAGTQVRDLSGLVVIPGLINTHVHFRQLTADAPGARSFDREAALRELERELYAGVTAVREMAGDVLGTAELARTARTAARPLPDVYFALVTAGPSFFASDPRVRGGATGARPVGIPGPVTGDTDLAGLVAFADSIGASGIKIYADLEADLVRRIAAEARGQGVQAWAHSTVFPTRPGQVVRAGVNGVSHVCGLVWEVLPSVPQRFGERPRFDPAGVDTADARFLELFADMARRRTMLDATLYLYTQPRARERGCVPELMIALARVAHRSGVLISTGTDFFNDTAEAYPSLHQEIEYLVEGGLLSPGEAITAATLNGARAIGIAATHGSIEPGKVADLVILDGDPTRDIRALRRVVAVVKHGRVYRREEYEARRRVR